MGIDISQMFGDAKAAASQGMTDLMQQGGNAALGFLEQNAIDIISQDKAQKDAALSSYVSNKLATPAAPGTFGAYLSNLVQNPVLKQYGGALLLGVVVVLAGGVFLAKKGKMI